MKFTIQNTLSSVSKGRLGKISYISRIPDAELQTPLLLLQTKGGSIMHLTHEVLQKVNTEVQALQMPLANSVKCYPGVKGFKGSISEFVGLKEYISYCTVQDPVVQTPHGYNIRSGISIWTSIGRMQISPDKFMDMMEAFQPDIYEALSDADTDVDSTYKRNVKSVENTTSFLKKCIQRHNSSKELSNSALFGVVEGGYNMRMRQNSVNSINSVIDSVSGIVISGIHSNGPEVENIQLHSVSPIISQTLELLPEEKVRVLHGCWRPDVVLGLVDLGVDLFDSSLVDVVTERNSAFVFQWKSVSRPLKHANGVNGILSSVNGHSEDQAMVEPKINGQATYKMEICLMDKVYFDDLSPVMESCECLTCTKHTKSYIHHLLNTKELLGSVLLMIHNLHHYLNFFHSIRESMQHGESIKVI